MYIVKYSEIVHMAEKLVHPRHLNSFRIVYDIHSITFMYHVSLESTNS